MTAKTTRTKPKRKVKGDDGSVKPAESDKSGKGRRPAPVARTPKKKNVKAPRVTPATYNKLQEAYFERQSIEEARKVAKVAFKTAKFYIEGPGRPDLGMTPIKQLWLDVQTEAQEKRQMTLLRFHEEQTKELEEILGTTLAELKLIRAEVFRRVKRYKDSGGKEIESGASMASALKTYERAARLMERFLGAPDTTLEHRGDEKYKSWTDEEIIEFMTTGTVPDHAR